MKKMLFLFAVLFSYNAALHAQNTDSTNDSKEVNVQLFFSFGMVANTPAALNDNLKMSGLPELNSTAPLIGVGYNITLNKFLMDVELETAYMNDRKSETDRVRTISTGILIRAHYVPVRWGNNLASVGLDAGYAYNQADIFSRGRQIDLNNLNPSAYTGHINLYNEMIYVGPSASVGIWQKGDNGVRFNLGYRWGISNGKWRSEFAEVNNTVKESGAGQFYVKAIVYF